ncbi:hypothetical protein INS49_009837 [Diaporthe citri]|uniref:uncharacterized protein n=1 Tax=Diaporthe citri TaxID=83186 RepID=UPI001C7E2AFF|nr:uncharacterized protein INS49_009837 [Diaporthe citri]KAG6361610.1 hypothetical protein INS49_009837 [Diaporthe citri]
MGITFEEEENPFTVQMQELFKWYQPELPHPPPAPKRGNASRQGQKNSTVFISAAFRAANRHPLGQPKLFRAIRASLGLRVLGNFQPWESNLLRDTTYLNPSYVAKFWLNRYFRLSQQFGESNPKIEEKHAYKGMPKADEVKRMAVIHVRRTPKTKVGRVMNDEFLKHVLDSIVQANTLCATRKHKAEPISHIMLYGDFDYREGLELRDSILRASESSDSTTELSEWTAYNGSIPSTIQSKRRQRQWQPSKNSQTKGLTCKDLNVSFLCRPWEVYQHTGKVESASEVEEEVEEVEEVQKKGQSLPKRATKRLLKKIEKSFKISHGKRSDPKKACRQPQMEHDEVIAEKVESLWQDFRRLDLVRLPVQVQILGIWTALCERYGDKICVIGHRSGFVEAAAFTGIPTFYLNDDRKKLERGSIDHKRLLVDAKAAQNKKRLREASDAMNTLIPVEMLEKHRVEKKDGAQGKRNSKEKDNQSGEQRNERGQHKEKEKGKQKTQKKEKQSGEQKSNVGQQDEGSESEAESEFEFHVDNSYRRELTAAIYIYMCCKVDLNTSEAVPVWRQRVKLMHDKEVGVKWLAEKRDFAYNPDIAKWQDALPDTIKGPQGLSNNWMSIFALHDVCWPTGTPAGRRMIAHSGSSGSSWPNGVDLRIDARSSEEYASYSAWVGKAVVPGTTNANPGLGAREGNPPTNRLTRKRPEPLRRIARLRQARFHAPSMPQSNRSQAASASDRSVWVHERTPMEPRVESQKYFPESPVPLGKRIPQHLLEGNPPLIRGERAWRSVPDGPASMNVKEQAAVNGRAGVVLPLE